ncbi:MAG: DUF935 family protein, partial [Marinobacterium sp.]
VDMGARIPAWWFHEKSGIPKAGKDEEVLRPKTALAPVGATRQPVMPVAALTAPTDSTVDVVNQYVDQLQQATEQPMTDMIDQIRYLVDTADSLDAIQQGLLALDLNADQLASAMTEALQAAALAGRYELLQEAE